MKNRLFTVIVLMVLMVTLTSNAQATSTASADPKALVYVKLNSTYEVSAFSSTQLPIYTWLDGGVLTGADPNGQRALDHAGLSFQVVDTDLRSGPYYVAETRSSRSIPDYSMYGRVLLEITNGVLLQMYPSQVDALAQAGAELRSISLTPKPIPSGQVEGIFPEAIDPDPLIQQMIDQVTTNKIYEYDKGLAGEEPVWVDGNWYTITSRRTNSGINIQKATHYVGQRMANLGMDVEYHVWSDATNPNVIGEIPGLTNPDDIFIIGGHVDDVQYVPGGADDNASGSVAAMIAADILSQYQWGCTLRFAVWTGEEQGLLGSHAYAHRAYQRGENILGYLNLDMIAWNTLNSKPNITLSYSSSDPDTYLLAQLFAEVVSDYKLDLIPTFDIDSSSSDHASFWDYGYNSILGIEDFGDFNPYYHGTNDTTINTDPSYFTNFVKASIGTFAHMSNCLIPEGLGALDGHVTAAAGGDPIEGATVTAEDSRGYSYSTTTDFSGYYTRTLIEDTYTVTATLDGYVPLSQSATITEGLVTTLDFVLEPACKPVTRLYISWLPANPFVGDRVTFTATASGTEPIDFQWEFGDTYTGTDATVTHTYAEAMTYTVLLSAANECGTDQASKKITVWQQIWEFFLPLVVNN